MSTIAMAPMLLGDRRAAYLLVILLVACSAFLLRKAPRRWQNGGQDRLEALSSVLLASGGLWVAFQVGFAWFDSIQIRPSAGVVLTFLWPRSDLSIPLGEIAEIAVFRLPNRGDKDYIQITLRTGQRITSSGPLPPAAELDHQLLLLPASRAPIRKPFWTIYIPSRTAEPGSSVQPQFLAH